MFKRFVAFCETVLTIITDFKYVYIYIYIYFFFFRKNPYIGKIYLDKYVENKKNIFTEIFLTCTVVIVLFIEKCIFKKKVFNGLSGVCSERSRLNLYRVLIESIR